MGAALPEVRPWPSGAGLSFILPLQLRPVLAGQLYARQGNGAIRTRPARISQNEGADDLRRSGAAQHRAAPALTPDASRTSVERPLDG